MRAVVQRVSAARVDVREVTVGQILDGVLVLLGAEKGDTESDVDYVARKVAHMRIFEDDDGLMNRSLLDIGGAALVVSQFTLLGDCRRGRRPSFVDAMGPEDASRMVDAMVAALGSLGVHVETGQFRATMSVTLTNEGPVTILVDSRKSF